MRYNTVKWSLVGLLIISGCYIGAMDDTVAIEKDLLEQSLVTNLQDLQVVQGCPHEKLTILFVDDNAFNRIVGEAALESLGTVMLAKNAEDALELLKEERYDVLVVDYEMPPGPTGLEMLKHLRKGQAGEKNKNTPAVLFTSVPRSSLEEGIQEVNAEYCAKPFDSPSVLRRRAQEAINYAQS